MIPKELLLLAYRRGVFPMAMENGEIGWVSPDPRGILPLDTVHLPHGLRRTLRSHPFQIRINTAFREVMKGCAGRDQTWISDELIDSYCSLHQQGLAHSVEAWLDDTLAGGLYGVALHGAFFGESMFHCVRDASKVALWALVERLRERKYTLLDVQWVTPHLRMFGAVEIPRRDYLRVLTASQRHPCKFVEEVPERRRTARA